MRAGRHARVILGTFILRDSSGVHVVLVVFVVLVVPIVGAVGAIVIRTRAVNEELLQLEPLPRLGVSKLIILPNATMCFARRRATVWSAALRELMYHRLLTSAKTRPVASSVQQR